MLATIGFEQGAPMRSTIFGMSDQGSWTYNFSTTVCPPSTFGTLRTRLAKEISDATQGTLCGLVVANGAIRVELKFETPAEERVGIIKNIIAVLRRHGCLADLNFIKVIEDGRPILEVTL